MPLGFCVHKDTEQSEIGISLKTAITSFILKSLLYYVKIMETFQYS